MSNHSSSSQAPFASSSASKGAPSRRAAPKAGSASSASPARAVAPAQPNAALSGFSYAPAFFQELTHAALAHARQLGATDAAAEASEGSGLSVSCRLGQLENIERNRDKSLGVTVYVGKARGNASTSDFSPAAVRQTVQAAFDIARYTAVDEVAGLPSLQDYAQQPQDQIAALDLFHPWALDGEQALELALRCEAAGLHLDRHITNSEGAGVSAQQSHFWAAHWRGEASEGSGRGIAFEGGYASSRHSLWAGFIAANGRKRTSQMQQASWSSSRRAAGDLASPERIGRYAAERALARLGAVQLGTRQCPVLFESTVARGLLGSLVYALSGSALYRKSSFLLDSLGQQVLPSHLSVVDDPFCPKGYASAPFDEEGVQTHKRCVVQEGIVQGYFLSCYSARKLGMKTTGNSGGAHNLTLTSRLTQAQDDLDAMLRKLGTGLFVTELMGQGVNYVTGDYSRGASGYWVEGGKIAYPVHEITIAGHLKEMLLGIVALGADTYTNGASTIGSVLIDRMTVAGN